VDRSYIYQCDIKLAGHTRSVNADGTPGDGIGSYCNEDLSSHSANVRVEAYACVRNGKLANISFKMVTNMLIFAGEEAKLDYGPEHWLPWLRAGHPLTSSICTKYCGGTDPYVWLTEFLAEKNHIILPPYMHSGITAHH
jgi:hypothetical protein